MMLSICSGISGISFHPLADTAPAPLPDALPDALIRRMHDAVDRFAGGADQFDDITMLCMKYYGNQDEKEEMVT